jgi:glycosyltransferase involved in cell wall biosynthesis
MWAAPVVAAEGVPMVVTVHSLWGYATPVFAALDRLVGWSRWPAVLTAVSDVAAEPLRRIAGPGTPIGVLPNGIDAAAWHVADPQPREPDDVLLAAVMRLAPRKRPLPLLRILRQVREQVPSSVRLRVMIVGDGPQRPAMERYLDRHALSSWVELTGRLDRARLQELYGRVDVFVAPARLESFGIAALEARAAGLPVVAMARAGIREFVRPGIEGLLAADDRGLADAVARLARDPALRAGIADHNRTHPPAMTWPRVLEACDQAYGRAAELVGG